MSTDRRNNIPDSRGAITRIAVVKYILLYVLLIPFINWSFTWAPMTGFFQGQFVTYFPNEEVPELAKWLFNPVTIVTGLVLVARDFAQREVGHYVLIAMAIALVLTAIAAGPQLALASGAAFAVSELVDWALFTFSKYKLSTRVLLSSALAAPIDTTLFLYGAEMVRGGMFTMPNIVMSITGKMIGAVVIWWIVKKRLEGAGSV